MFTWKQIIHTWTMRRLLTSQADVQLLLLQLFLENLKTPHMLKLFVLNKR